MRKCLLSFITLILVGCSQLNQESEFKGNVFIVTNGAQNIKLGLVEITVIPEKEMTEFLDKKKILIDAEKEKLKKAADQASTESDEASSRYQSAKTGLSLASGKVDSAISAIRDTKSYDELDEAKNRAQSTVNDYQFQAVNVDDLKNKYDKKAMDYQLAKFRYESFPTASFVLAELPMGIAKATSDADGNYNFKVPQKGKYVLAAHSSRLVVGEKEEYFWLIRFNADGKPQQPLMLTNINLMTSDSKDNVMKVAAMN